MSAHENEIQSLMKRLLEPVWKHEWIKEHYGIELGAAPPSFIAQYRIWVETFRGGDEKIDLDGVINRFYLELFLQHRGLVGIRTAAVLLGMTEKSFSETLTKAREEKFITEQEEVGDFPGVGVYRSSFVSDFYRRFSQLAKFTFSSYPSFCRRLHETINKELKMEVVSALCPTSAKLNEDPIDIGHDLDALTGEPIGLPFQVWLETGKPIQLKPDLCSWLTYARNEEFLKGYSQVDMDKDEDYQMRRDELQK